MVVADASTSESLSSIKLFVALDRVDGRDVELVGVTPERVRDGEALPKVDALAFDGDEAATPARERVGDAVVDFGRA